VLGPGATLVVTELAVLDTDAVRARALARGPLDFLATVPGYRANFARMGFSADDIAGRTDRLVDALVAWGDADAIGARIAAHRAAGADHVVLSVLGADPLAVAARLPGLAVPRGGAA
jgi:probable F420-dependent oxidoreductase